MIKTSTGEVCSPNEDIKALDLHGTNALRARLLQIQADSGSGEDALYAETQIELGAEQAEQAKQAEAEQAAKQALSDFRSYLDQSPGSAAQALPSDAELAYNYNPDTQQCEITRTDDEDMVLDIANSGLNGELLLPPQLMVTRLDCSDNELTTLPEVLPASLTVLWCDNNQLTSLPEVLPASLTLLNCDNNQLTTLPEVLPASLTKLLCSDNQLTTLPEVLPASLTVLWCANNQLTSLPEVLPASLTLLGCSNNLELLNNPAAQAAPASAKRQRGNGTVMIKTSTGEVCSPNEDIKALDLHGTNALRARLLQIQADSGSGEDALLAECDACQ